MSQMDNTDKTPVKLRVIASPHADSSSTSAPDDIAVSETRCTWCHRPRRLFTTEITSHANSDLGEAPVCCSQICFDQLRRAQFKKRRCNTGSSVPLPSLVTSGRPPYVPYSHLGTNKSDSNVIGKSVSPVLSQTMKSIPQGTRRRLPRVASADHHASATTSSKTRDIMLNSSCSVAQEQGVFTQASTVTCPKPKTFLNQAGYSQPNSEATEHEWPKVSTGSPSFSALSDLLYLWLTCAESSQPSADPYPPTSNRLGEVPSASVSETQAECSPVIVPVFLPVFKNAPEILDILHRYGFHSQFACPLRKSYENASTQTSSDDDHSSYHSTRTAHMDSEDSVLDLRIPKPSVEFTSTTASSHRNAPVRLVRCGTWYQMSSVNGKAKKLVKFSPISSKTTVRRRRGQVHKWHNRSVSGLVRKERDVIDW
ncbi:hypothetical protein T265_04368 [Opisthorchis viverrini]|uniref:Uncharacterized protein n=1 Tax=Opisthorchis viverrini TaxID=6198 RepID=A0A074ZND5_OPIVI|nr:hypothetical protein T265_04368 [Opisthorchis viverrini]KER28908.1 hypothetical protein T265_04368 [Opisthorchis viverrini]